MSRIAFLFDEHMPASAAKALLGLEPSIRLRIVGIDPDVPPKGTPDPDLLVFAETEGFAIVTFDKDTMPCHADQHMARGRQTLGLFVFPNGNNLSAGRVAEELHLIWSASDANEWINRTGFLPL